MRIKRSVARFFGLMILPAATIAVVGYFGGYAVWGERGMLALGTTRVQLGEQQKLLAQLGQTRARLEHRIALMEQGDPDLVEELARTRLMDGAPNQVAVSRDAH